MKDFDVLLRGKVRVIHDHLHNRPALFLVLRMWCWPDPAFDGHVLGVDVRLRSSRWLLLAGRDLVKARPVQAG